MIDNIGRKARDHAAAALYIIDVDGVAVLRVRIRFNIKCRITAGADDYDSIKANILAARHRDDIAQNIFTTDYANANIIDLSSGEAANINYIAANILAINITNPNVSNIGCATKIDAVVLFVGVRGDIAPKRDALWRKIDVRLRNIDQPGSYRNAGLL